MAATKRCTAASLVLLIVVVGILTVLLMPRERTTGCNEIFVATMMTNLEKTGPINTSISKNIRENVGHQCDTIHIAVPVKRLTNTLVLLKSILLYRQSPLHFHFIVLEDFVEEAATKLMDTWRLPQVNFTVYNTKSFFVSPHSTEFSSLVKLQITSILPDNIDKVIFIDTGILITANIKDLWMQFYTNENINVPFGASDLQDDFCVSKNSILLFNLKAMREFHWSSTIAGANPIAQLCDVANQFKSFNISCSWKLNNKKPTDECRSLTINDYKALDSSSDSFMHVQYCIKLKEFINQYDGSLLTYIPVPNCGKSNDSQTVLDESEEEFLKNPNVAMANGHKKLMCQLLKSHSRVFRTVLYYYGDPYIPKEDHETTLVTQFSMNRLRTLRLLIEQWDGPLSISMYGSDYESSQFSEFLSLFGLLSKRNNINIHMIYKEGEFYPVNYLRNIAINTVKTAYVFLNDGDFIPMKGLFTYLKRAGRVLIDKEHPETALVVPAFQTSQFRLNYPKSKRELVQMIKKKSVSTFCPECAHKSHQATNYDVYFHETKPYLLVWVNRYEPYIVVRSDVVRYDERFMGYGYNKLAHITLLKAQGYRFIGLPDVFIIHTPHPPTVDREIWDHPSFKACIDSMWEDYYDRPPWAIIAEQ